MSSVDVVSTRHGRLGIPMEERSEPVENWSIFASQQSDTPSTFFPDRDARFSTELPREREWMLNRFDDSAPKSSTPEEA